MVDSGLLEALNKIDLLPVGDRDEILNQARRRPDSMPISAITGEGIPALMAILDSRLSESRETIDISLPHSDGATIAWLYQHGEVMDRRDDDDSVHMSVRLDSADVQRLRQRQGKGKDHEG